MIRIRTGSRLHFGLFSLPSEDAGQWLNQEGQPTIPRRQFGGVGLMIDSPGIELTVEEAVRWSAEGPLEERALQFAKCYCTTVGVTSGFRICIRHAGPEHSGLGAGTQLGLAVARALAELTKQPRCDAVTLASAVGRGRRSALGVHGFDQGGFLVEAGKSPDAAIAPLLVHRDFPDDWQILLIRPRDVVGMHGRRETEAFANLVKRPPDDRATESLCRLVLLGLLPALAENDLRTFGEALYDFNRRSGAMFKTAQGGIYAHPRIDQIVKSIRELGVKGVGQSSWGPTIFAIGAAEELGAIRKWMIAKWQVTDEEIIFAGACNHGSALSTEY